VNRLYAAAPLRLRTCADSRTLWGWPNFQHRLEWIIFVAGLATPAIMALIVTPDAPSLPSLTHTPVVMVRANRSCERTRPQPPLTPCTSFQGATRCRVVAPPSVELFFACQGATVRKSLAAREATQLCSHSPSSCPLRLCALVPSSARRRKRSAGVNTTGPSQ